MVREQAAMGNPLAGQANDYVSRQLSGANGFTAGANPYQGATNPYASESNPYLNQMISDS